MISTPDILIALGLGFLFGWVLDKGGLNRYYKIANVFRFTDLTVLRFMMTGVAVGVAGIYTLKYFGLVDLTAECVDAGDVVQADREPLAVPDLLSDLDRPPQAVHGALVVPERSVDVAEVVQGGRHVERAVGHLRVPQRSLEVVDREVQAILMLLDDAQPGLGGGHLPVVAQLAVDLDAFLEVPARRLRVPPVEVHSADPEEGPGPRG